MSVQGLSDNADLLARADVCVYTGPLNKANQPEGIGFFDYLKYASTSTMSGERRTYYSGSVVAGRRQGPGVLRWIDHTEYVGEVLCVHAVH